MAPGTTWTAGQHLLFHYYSPLDEAIAYRAVIVIVSVADVSGYAGGNAFGASKITQKRQEIDHMCQWGANRNPKVGAIELAYRRSRSL